MCYRFKISDWFKAFANYVQKPSMSEARSGLCWKTYSFKNQYFYEKYQNNFYKWYQHSYSWNQLSLARLFRAARLKIPNRFYLYAGVIYTFDWKANGISDKEFKT